MKGKIPQAHLQVHVYRNSHNVHLQIFHINIFVLQYYICPFEMRSIYALCKVLLVNNISVRNLHRCPSDEKFLTTKTS